MADKPEQAAAAPEGPSAEPLPGFVGRVGLTILHPRWALAVGGDRRRAGGSGSDLLALITIVLVATQLRGLVYAGWIAISVNSGLGGRIAATVLTQALAVELGFLVVGATLIYVAAGKRRELGRAFDLACVAALPLLFVDLGASVVTFAAGVEPTPVLGWSLSGLAYAWTGVLLALAIGPARAATSRKLAVPEAIARPGRRAGWLVLAVALVGVGVQVRYVTSNPDELRPLIDGGPAPAFELPTITAAGTLGAPLTLASLAGKPVVLDFWATWCGPCLASMPVLDAFGKAHPEVAVVTVNLDDPAAARALFTAKGYTLQLVAGGDDISRRYNAVTIPHTVVIDRAGQVRKIGSALDMDLEDTIAALAK